MRRHAEILKVLADLEEELKSLELWGGEISRPKTEAFASQIPFCLDTMDFHEWLEYVLIARLRELISLEQELPSAMLTHTMAQEVYRGQWHKYRSLIGLLRRLDELCSAKQEN